MLKLVGHNWGVRLPGLADTKSLLGVSDSVVENALGASHTHGGDTKSTGEQTVSNFEEAGTCFRDVGYELTIGGHVVEGIEKVFSGNAYLVEAESSIIDTVESELEAHIFNKHTFTGFHVSISNGDDESVDSFVLTRDDGLGKDDGKVCVAGSVGDPVLLGLHGRAVNNKLFRVYIVGGRGFHLGSIVSVS